MNGLYSRLPVFGLCTTNLPPTFAYPSASIVVLSRFPPSHHGDPRHFFFFPSRRRHTRSLRDWSSDVCSSDLPSSQRGASAFAIVADDTWAAMKGMKALAPRWDDGPNAAVQQAAIVSQLEAAVRESGVVAASKGHPAESAAGAAHHHEAIYHQPFLAHATLEPMNCTVDWREDVCEIWTGTQACDRAVARLAALGLKPEQIRLHSYLIGGGFGRRLEVDGIVLAARVARHVQGPVRVLWPREEDIQHDRYRPYYVDRLSASLDARGMPLAWRHTIAGAGL